jgi:5-methylcytosine-specific restriction endonuclease McrA
MPTGPYNPPSAIEAFKPLIKRQRGQIVRNLQAEKAVRNRRQVAKVRAQGKCEFPACSGWRTGYVDPHHIKSRGSGGGDTRLNLIGLCRECHNKVHNGEIPKAVLLAIVAERK